MDKLSRTLDKFYTDSYKLNKINKLEKVNANQILDTSLEIKL